MIFLCYPKCSTCQKAQKWLEANGIQCEIRHIKDDRPTAAELRKWHKISGLLYKEQGLKDKLPTMTEDEMYALLATNGMLVKRPMFIGDDFVLVGFKETEWEKALK